MTHPLTGEMVQDIWDKVKNEKSGGFTQDDLMRAATDWQLEQVIEWLNSSLHRYTDASFDGVTVIDYDNLFKDLKEAMRPTMQEES